MTFSWTNLKSWKHRIPLSVSRWWWRRLDVVTAPYDTQQLELVVARYNEDVSWLGASRRVATIYNKGPALDLNARIITLGNTGREAHSYLHHIIERYETLADRTVFLQGRINDRMEQWLLPPGRYVRPGTVAVGRQMKFTAEGWRYHAGGISQSPFTFHEFVEDVLGLAWQNNAEFAPGAYFAVPRELILGRPKSYYETVMRSSRLDQEKNPEEAHYFERCWMRLFPSIK